MKNKIIILLVFISVIFTSCNNIKKEYITNTMIFMDTVCSIKIYDKQKEDILNGAFDLLKKLDEKLSSYNEDSEISNINNNAGVSPVKVSDETMHVIKTGIEYGDISNGSFDITAYPIVDLWGITTGNNVIPDNNSIKEKLNMVDYKQIIVDDSKKTIYIPEGYSLDLGGIAKGYAAQLVKEYIYEEGVESAIINFGGNVDVIGKNINKNLWSIGIKLPFSDDNSSIGKISIEDTSVVTSGIYERYFKVGDEIYHHILDLSTGYPVNNNLESISIISPDSEKDDALSTIVFIMGLKEGYKFIESLDGVEAIFITKDKKVYLTSGINNFKLFENDYEIDIIE